MAKRLPTGLTSLVLQSYVLDWLDGASDSLVEREIYMELWELNSGKENQFYTSQKDYRQGQLTCAQ